MVKRCVVQFCTDSNKTGHTMQIFPNDANLKRQFVKFVQVKIADFVEPFEHSVVCSSHFSSWCCTDDSDPTRSKLFGSMKTTHTVRTVELLKSKRSTEKVQNRFTCKRFVN